MGPSRSNEIVPALAGRHEPLPLPFDAAKLKGLSERLLRSHWENDYCGAVKALNSVEQRLAATLDGPDLATSLYADLKREEFLCTGSARLHELYFGNLGGDGSASRALEQILGRAFGSFSRWEAEFRRTAAALAGGSGWVILATTPDGELHNYSAGDHANAPPGSHPLLVLDMYEHAYHLDHGSAAARYIDAFVANVAWEPVAERLAAAMRGWRGRDETWSTTSTPG